MTNLTSIMLVARVAQKSEPAMGLWPLKEPLFLFLFLFFGLNIFLPF
jgi:hypothetical protein